MDIAMPELNGIDAARLIVAGLPSMRGERYLSPSIAGVIAGRAIVRGSPSNVRAEKQLTPRERQVLQLLAEGKSSKEIAVALEIALPTVETHRHQLTAKLHLRTIAELTKYAIREGITSVEP